MLQDLYPNLARIKEKQWSPLLQIETRKDSVTLLVVRELINEKMSQNNLVATKKCTQRGLLLALKYVKLLILI